MTRKAYRKYDAIWDEGIQITAELEKLGVIAAINGKMPNLLMRKANRPTASDIAARYDFASVQSLLNYLLAYEPRGKYENSLYLTLLQEKLKHCSPREREVASAMTAREIRAVMRECNTLAREMTQTAYEKYDEIWATKIRITPELLKHGKDTVGEINRKMPNLLTHDPSRSALDQVAMYYDFESAQDLVDYLLAYEPRTGYQEQLADQMARETLGLADEYISETVYEIDQVPF